MPMFPEKKFEDMVKSKADDIFGTPESCFNLDDIRRAESTDRLSSLKSQMKSYIIIAVAAEFEDDTDEATLYIQMRKNDHLDSWYVHEHQGNPSLSAEQQVIETARAALFTDVRREIWQRVMDCAQEEME